MHEMHGSRNLSDFVLSSVERDIPSLVSLAHPHPALAVSQSSACALRIIRASARELNKHSVVAELCSCADRERLQAEKSAEARQ